MVVRVIAFTVFAGDDAPGAAITPSLGGNGIFPIIAAPLDRQTSFEVAEHRPIPLVRERPALFDQFKGRSRFIGELVDRDLLNGSGRLILAIDGWRPGVE